MSSQTALRMKIEGMDCGACAVKIENAMRGLPGVSDISVSYSAALLSLNVDADRTSRNTIEARVRSLGFTPLKEEASGTQSAISSSKRRSWWKTAKGRLIIASGGLFVGAYALAQVRPEWEYTAYFAATVVGLSPIVRRAVAGIRTGTPFSIETLMSVAAIGALAIGAAEEAALVVLLFAVGELLEGIAAGRARAGIEALIKLAPRTAIRVAGETFETVSVEALVVGDIVVVRPGDRIPSDGIVREGASEVNQAPITGESVPVAKSSANAVYAGSINGLGELRIELTNAAADNTLSRIIHLVEEAQATKAPTARFIDNFSVWYTPAAMLAALVVIVAPPLLFAQDWATWIYRGLSLLLIACPCALVISTPAAIASGLASGARRGLLIKGGGALETLAKVRTIAFDKTGTLTAGRPQVTDVLPFDGADAGDMLAKAAAVEQGSSHPLGVAIIAEAALRNLTLPRVFGGSLAMPGKSVTGRLISSFISVSSPRYASERDFLTPQTSVVIGGLEEQGKTVVVVSEGKRALGLIALRDEPRADATDALATLRKLGIRTIMLTGDNARAASAIGAKLGLEAKAELLPGDKLRLISELKAQAPIAMVGDGINDAPALAASSVGIAMGGGSDVALETADAALLQNRVSGVADLVALSRATMANIWQNVGLALGLKAIFLVTSLTGLSSLWMAILADTGATVLVTANALRLLQFKSAGRM